MIAQGRPKYTPSLQHMRFVSVEYMFFAQLMNYMQRPLTGGWGVLSVLSVLSVFGVFGVSGVSGVSGALLT